MTQSLPSFEKQLRAYLTDVNEFDIRRIIDLHEMNKDVKVVNYVVEEKIVEVKRISKICPICQRNHAEVKARITVQQIEDIVVEIFNIDRAQMYGRTRRREIVYPRQIIMFLTREHTNYSHMRVGMKYNKDHTTVIHSIQTIKDLIQTDPKTAGIIQEIEEKLFKHE